MLSTLKTPTALSAPIIESPQQDYWGFLSKFNQPTNMPPLRSIFVWVAICKCDGLPVAS